MKTHYHLERRAPQAGYISVRVLDGQWRTQQEASNAAARMKDSLSPGTSLHVTDKCRCSVGNALLRRGNLSGVR